MTKLRKKISERLEKFSGNFTLNFRKVCAMEFQNKIRERLKVKVLE